jgi:hypothetical protein
MVASRRWRTRVSGITGRDVRAPSSAPDLGMRGMARTPRGAREWGRDWSAVVSAVRRATMEVQLDAVGEALAVPVLREQDEISVDLRSDRTGGPSR